MSEQLFETIYPQAVPVLQWFDYTLNGMLVEVKECFMNSRGRFKIKVENHEMLVDEGGMYFLVLKRKQPGGAISPDLRCRWLYSCSIDPNLEADNTFLDRGHRNDTEEREMMRLNWSRYFEDDRYGTQSESTT